MMIEISNIELSKIVADHVRQKMGIKNKLTVTYFIVDGKSNVPNYVSEFVIAKVDVPNKVVK